MSLKGKEREMYILEHQKEWSETGAGFRLRRERIGLTVTYAAKKIGIGRQTLVRFEDGEPVLNCRRIIANYSTLLDYEQLKRQFHPRVNSIYGQNLRIEIKVS